MGNIFVRRRSNLIFMISHLSGISYIAPFRIKNTTSQITTLAWDPPGSKLFVGMEDGTAEVYGMVDHLLNKWAVSYSACLPGEPVLTSAWLSAPRKVGQDKGQRLMEQFSKLCVIPGHPKSGKG